MSIVPVTANSLVYGTSDAGVHVVNSDEIFNDIMKLTAKKLNLQSHKVRQQGHDSTSSEITLHSAADLEGAKIFCEKQNELNEL